MKKPLLIGLACLAGLLSLRLIYPSLLRRDNPGSGRAFGTIALYQPIQYLLSDRHLFVFGDNLDTYRPGSFPFFPSEALRRRSFIPEIGGQTDFGWVAFTLYGHNFQHIVLTTDKFHHGIRQMILVQADGSTASYDQSPLISLEPWHLLPRMQAVTLSIRQRQPVTVYLQLRYRPHQVFQLHLYEHSYYATLTVVYNAIVFIAAGSLLLMLGMMVYIQLLPGQQASHALGPFTLNVLLFGVLVFPEAFAPPALQPFFNFAIPALAILLSASLYGWSAGIFDCLPGSHRRMPATLIGATACYIGSLLALASSYQLLADLTILGFSLFASLTPLARRYHQGATRPGTRSLWLLIPAALLPLSSLILILSGRPLFVVFEQFKYPALLVWHCVLLFTDRASRLRAQFSQLRDTRQQADEQVRFLIARQKDQRSTIFKMLLNPLHSTMEILESIEIDPATAQLARTVRFEISKIGKLISSLDSFYTRGESSDDLIVSNENMAVLADSAVRLTRYLSANQQVQFTIDCQPVSVSPDGKILQKIMAGLMYREEFFWAVNKCALDIRRIGSTIQIVIRNNGPVDQEMIDHNPFTELAELIGATIGYERDSTGNTYRLSLPQYRDTLTVKRPVSIALPEHLPEHLPGHLPQAPAPLPAKHPATGVVVDTGQTVLLLNEEPVSLFAIKRRLETNGWQVRSFLQPDQAIEALRSDSDFTAVLVESGLRDLTGYEFCRLVRGLPTNARLPIIIIINNNTTREINEVFQAGGDDYLLRPFSTAELLARLTTHAQLAASNRRELEQKSRIAEIDKMHTLSWLTAGLAHEINTPNNSILRNLPVLREIWTEITAALEKLYRLEGVFNVRGFSYNELQTEIPAMLNDIYGSAQHIRKIVAELKEFSGAGGENQLSGIVDVNQAIQYATRLLRHAIAASTTDFRIELDGQRPLIRGDKLKLTQIIVNVMENALQALERPDAMVKLETRLHTDAATGQPERVSIVITDQGCGMTAETLKSLYNPFFTTKRDRGGTGLGMAVVSGILRELDAAIEVDSAPGRGTTITISMKAVAGDSEDDAENGERHEPQEHGHG
ncbi:MAG TPA: hypothetical protein DCX65_00515 [Spirochaetaceae bacterium]|nr:hypothetical protein [Spirochaetaceae bacterium]